MHSGIQAHWDEVYSVKGETEVSWFQPYPKTSMKFVQMLNLPTHARIIDIGGGDSRFVDALLDSGYKNIYVLDISAKAIERAKQRLGSRAESVQWIVSDVTHYTPAESFDLWHDRAAFHFLTDEERISRYVAIAGKALPSGGSLILGTFSQNGPRKCSGLEIQQYSEASMSTRFEAAFDRIKCVEEQHITPFQATQNFLFCSFRKK